MEEQLGIREQEFFHSNVEGYWDRSEEFYPSEAIFPAEDLYPEGGTD